MINTYEIESLQSGFDEMKQLAEQLTKGVFKSMKLKYIPYTVVQCTWGIIQTIVGFVFFCSNFGEKHSGKKSMEMIDI